MSTTNHAAMSATPISAVQLCMLELNIGKGHQVIKCTQAYVGYTNSNASYTELQWLQCTQALVSSIFVTVTDRFHNAEIKHQSKAICSYMYRYPNRSRTPNIVATLRAH